MTTDASVGVAVGLGSNLGDRERNLRLGLGGLEEVLEVTGRSRVYETLPVGEVDQPLFLNMCVTGRTGLPPGTLLERLLAVEARAGRRRGGVEPETPGVGPRILDLDLLLYGDEEHAAPGLEVPHPRLAQRSFVLVPLAEIAPAWHVPGTGRTVGELAETAGADGVEVYGRALVGEAETGAGREWNGAAARGGRGMNEV